MDAPRFSLTVDVEEWFQVENLRGVCPPEKWDGLESRVAASVEILLDALREESAGGATFFVLGWIAKRHSDLVKKISGAGFEIASHGMDHVLPARLSPERLRADLADSKALLEDLTGREVAGYRAPAFSIGPEAVEALRACGYRYDSSFNDFSMHGRYGALDLSGWDETAPGVWRHPAGDFHEAPVTNLRALGFAVPWAGGGYFRLVPAPVYRMGVRSALRARGHFTFYMHPWEIDPAQPRLLSRASFSGFRHYTNLERTLPRLRALIRMVKDSGARFVSIRERLETGGWRPEA